jgi:hypothetical protein
VSLRTPSLTERSERELAAVLPTTAAEPCLAMLGSTRFRSRRGLFGIRTDDRWWHLAVMEKAETTEAVNY